MGNPGARHARMVKSTHGARSGRGSPRIIWHLLGLAMFAVLPFFALAAWHSLDLIARENEQATEHLQRSVAVTASAVELLVGRVRTLLSRLALRERVHALDPGNCDPALLAIKQVNAEYTNVFTVAADGTRVCSGLPLPPWIPSGVDPTHYLDPLKATRRITFGPPVVGSISGRWVVYAVEPITHDGSLAGLVGLGIDLAALTSVVDPRALPTSGVSLVLDLGGRVLTRHPSPEAWIGFEASAWPIAQAALQGGSGTLRGAGLDGIDRIWAYGPVRGADWIVLSGIPAGEVLERSHRYAAWILGIGMALTLGVILFSRRLARRIAAPIEAIARAAPALGTEEFQRLTSQGPAEAAELAAELNRRHDQTLAMQRRLADERTRLDGLVASAMDAVVTVDFANRILLFNAAAERMFGVEAKDVIGTSLDRLIPPRYRTAHAGHMARFREAGPTGRQMARLGMVHGIRANGEEFPIEASISQVEVAGERYLTAIVRDITERVKAEDALREAAARLEQRVVERTSELEAANKELQAFDYSISHDLRAPLGRIHGFATALAEDYGERLDEAGRGYLARIVATSRDMDRLVHDMLELSLVSRREMERGDADLSAFARAVVDSLRHSHPGRQVEAVVQPGLTEHADANLTRIVLENLLGNAWKFTSKREAARIEFGAVEQDGRRAFFVRDNGAGFDPAGARHLFEPFRRLHSKAEYPGTGVGLATVHRIVLRHGGRTWAEGATGQGATFYFTLRP